MLSAVLMPLFLYCFSFAGVNFIIWMLLQHLHAIAVAADADAKNKNKNKNTALNQCICKYEDKYSKSVILQKRALAAAAAAALDLDTLKHTFVMETTPLGNVLMMYNSSREMFEYYSDQTIPYRFLEVVCRKFVKMFDCPQLYFDMTAEIETCETVMKEKEEQKRTAEEATKNANAAANANANANANARPSKNVFAKFKSYNKDSLAVMNRGVVAGERGGTNSNPRNNQHMQSQVNAYTTLIVKERLNRYSYKGKLSTFNILQKPNVATKRKLLSFSEFAQRQKNP